MTMTRIPKGCNLMRECFFAIALMLARATAASAAVAPGDPNFLNFPRAANIAGAAKADAFAWVVQQGPMSYVLLGAAPDFKPRVLYSKSDEDGQPISDLVLSPDGKFIVFQTAVPFLRSEHTYNPANLIERPRVSLWSLEARPGATPRQIGSGVGPIFLADGRLLFRHDADLHTLDLTSADPQDQVLIKGGAGFDHLQALSNGRILFSSDRGGYAFVGVFTPGAAAIEWLATGPDRLQAPAVSPDGKHIAYLRFPGRQHSVVYDITASEPFSIETLDMSTRVTHEVWRSSGPAGGSPIQDRPGLLRWTDDQTLTFHSEQDGWDRIYKINPEVGAPHAITPANCEAAESAAVAHRILAVLHNCHDIDTRQLSLISVVDGRDTDIPASDIVMTSLRVSGGHFLAYARGDTDSPPLMRIYNLNTKKLVYRETVAEFAWRAPFTSAPPKPVTFKADDGLTIHGQLFLPAGNGRHPSLIYVHGGPLRQMFPAFHFDGYYANDFAVNRMLADQGYVVLSINYRSGVGYGQAFREHPERGWRGASEYRDILGGVVFLKNLTQVDPKRLGIRGGSYGGWLVGLALARNSDIFNAGVAAHGVFDWSWQSTRAFHLNPSLWFGVGPAEKAKAFSASPVAEIATWKSPVLLFSGDEDLNVDVLETIDLTQRLRALDVDVRTTIIPGEAHVFVRHATWVELWNDTQSFFSEKLNAR